MQWVPLRDLAALLHLARPSVFACPCPLPLPVSARLAEYIILFYGRTVPPSPARLSASAPQGLRLLHDNDAPRLSSNTRASVPAYALTLYLALPTPCCVPACPHTVLLVITPFLVPVSVARYPSSVSSCFWFVCPRPPSPSLPFPSIISLGRYDTYDYTYVKWFGLAATATVTVVSVPFLFLFSFLLRFVPDVVSAHPRLALCPCVRAYSRSDVVLCVLIMAKLRYYIE
ncbi:hypothetical protein EVG20_g8938 [Dentipellis fragilis]|uniref:Uncharacterized protein n=1 Tax=Dentipellis fragilis TaxID=205917 RepID=A0A4Y9Y1Q0_9AGAM|nr:hypothetical protein EVG20_g8938 [Dentipellis fragilis]